MFGPSPWVPVIRPPAHPHTWIIVGTPGEVPDGPPKPVRDEIRQDVRVRPCLASDARYVAQLLNRIEQLEDAYDRQSNVVSKLADRIYGAG